MRSAAVAVLAMQTSAPWWVTLSAPAIAAVITVVGGSLVVTGYLSRRNARWEESRQIDFRSELASDMARVANDLQFRSSVYRRKVEQGNFDGDADKAKARTSLDKSYIRLRAEGAAIEARLRGHFELEPPKSEVGTPWKDWHAVMDLLTIQYFAAIRPEGKEALPDLLTSNAGQNHSGLTEKQLKDQSRVEEEWRERLSKATHCVLTQELKMPK